MIDESGSGRTKPTGSARPRRRFAAEMQNMSDGGARLTIPLPARTGWAARLLRLPTNATKTFEFDPLGRFVYERCDGTVTPGKIATALARAFGVSDREARVAVGAFLETMTRRGLIEAVDDRE